MTMEALQIVDLIEKMPVLQRVIIAERILCSIRKDEEKLSLEQAADLLYDDYVNDKELTAFTALDCEDFYEAR